MLAYLEASDLEIIDVDRERVFAAAHLKAAFPVAYTDAFAATLTRELNATLLTGDPEFRALAVLIPIEWLAAEP